MTALVLIALAGFGASFIDGALGMGFGVTSTTLLLAVGLTPALASASVHLAKLGTAAASGAAHHKFGNVDWTAVRRIAAPGAVGAFAGATALSHLSSKAAVPVTATILLLLGIYIVARFTVGVSTRRAGRTPSIKLMIPLGLIGGFIDATGGGGWGPVTTPTLLADGRMSPARVIGTVNTAEFIVALAASLGFLLGLGTSGIDLGVVAALLIGGAVAAPLAAWLVRYLNPRILGVAAGCFIIALNARSLLTVSNAPEVAWWATYLVWTAGSIAAVTVTARAARRARTRERVQTSTVTPGMSQAQCSPGGNP